MSAPGIELQAQRIGSAACDDKKLIAAIGSAVRILLEFVRWQLAIHTDHDRLRTQLTATSAESVRAIIEGPQPLPRRPP